MQHIDKVADVPVHVQRQVSTTQAAQLDTQHIDGVVRDPALLQNEVPAIPDADDPCLDVKADEDRLEHDGSDRPTQPDEVYLQYQQVTRIDEDGSFLSTRFVETLFESSSTVVSLVRSVSCATHTPFFRCP